MLNENLYSMKRKLFAISTAMLFLIGTFFFSTQHHADNEQEALIVKTAEALAGPGDELTEPCPNGDATNCYFYEEFGGCEVVHDCEVVCLGGC